VFKILFTIAIPVYNNENTIKDTIISCINQDYNNNYEILVVDNNSNDNTYEILKELSDEINIVRNLKTITMYENHNVCLKNAKGDYVLFCHADDTLEKTALLILEEKIKERNYPKKYVVWGRSKFRDYFNNWKKGQVELNNVLSGQFALDPFFYGGVTPSGTCYSKNSFLELDGFINSNHKLSPSDMTTMICLAYNGFEFEMIDRLYFNREFASTAVDHSYNDMLNAVVDSMESLKKRMSENEFEILIRRSFSLTNVPVLFISTLIKMGYSKQKLLNYIIKKSIKNPKLFIKYILLTKYRYLIKLLFFE